MVWLQPLPDTLIDDRSDQEPGPEARVEQSESISLAFVTALQLLPPRQLAVLVLRDVLGFPAAEVAEMLDTTVESVTSALKRARAAVARRRSAAADQGPAPVAGSPAEEALVSAFVRAYEASDIDALVALLTDDVFVSMPPMPYEYEGREAAMRFCDLIFRDGRRFDLVPTRANGQPAFGLYLHAPDGRRHAAGFLVITLVRRPGLRDDPLRERPAALVRATANPAAARSRGPHQTHSAQVASTRAKPNPRSSTGAYAIRPSPRKGTVPDPMIASGS